MAQSSTLESLREFNQTEVHEQLTGLANELASRGSQFNIERDFGVVRYDRYQDEICPKGELAQPALQDAVTAYERECFEVARVLVESYVGGMKVTMEDVDLMLVSLDNLTIRREPVTPARVRYHAEELRQDREDYGRKFTRASWDSLTDPELTRARRARLYSQFSLATLPNDNPSNPHAIALAKVLESRWDL